MHIKTHLQAHPGLQAHLSRNKENLQQNLNKIFNIFGQSVVLQSHWAGVFLFKQDFHMQELATVSFQVYVSFQFLFPLYQLGQEALSNQISWCPSIWQPPLPLTFRNAEGGGILSRTKSVAGNAKRNTAVILMCDALRLLLWVMFQN